MRYIIAISVMILSILTPFTSYAEESTFTPTSQQNGVRTSTDVIAVTLPATALIVTLIERDWKGLKQGALTAAVTAGVTIGLKYLVKENRPDFSNRHSFPSGHSAVTFAAATYIGRRYGWKWSIPAYALSAYTAWGRVYGKKHHWWDVAAGAAIGAASAMIFTHPYMKKHEVALVPAVSETSAGVVLGFSF
ncbi:MAG: phosphatase PAP2 family protein [Muribaculaceae bacterium]|nr:phosphatase PAP2 family protein [Muribaculaceae bacterium]